LRYITDITQRWVGEHHAVGGVDLAADQAKLERDRGIYHQLGLVDEQPLPPGEYDHLVVLGGLQTTNDIRTAFLGRMLDSGVILKPDAVVTLWGGERALIPVEGAKVQAGIDALAGRRDNSRDPWLRKVSEIGDVVHEAGGMRLSAHVELGGLSLHGFGLKLLADETDNNWPLVYDWRFEASGGVPVVLLNGPSVPRNMGTARHTTESCAGQWLQLYGSELEREAKVGFISSQPYGLRTTKAAQSAISALGRPDIQLVGGGPAAHDGIKDLTFKGEIGRNIYQDQS
jgi:hypothetical protein